MHILEMRQLITVYQKLVGHIKNLQAIYTFAKEKCREIDAQAVRVLHLIAFDQLRSGRVAYVHEVELVLRSGTSGTRAQRYVRNVLMHDHGVAGATMLEVRELFGFCRIGIVINEHSGSRADKEFIAVRKNGFNAPAEVYRGEIDRLSRLGDIKEMELALTYGVEKVAIEGKARHGAGLAICPAG